ncbi:Uncharacterized protein TPAR_03367 [Tolypocladium paradoxum]|uniref:DNA (cytosine-5)-methyltransferase 1 replication foci domain-containing protein n=1 Tax=Tolypocladium paradoxum TaxID=94208 RepID=A0A2S4L1Z6_9HYPO|nr:Uncharacterized protein TPAR_03367 [Tolypocladium paradoxum]
MAGRKRRASTSSVESVDETQIRWRQEHSVVRSVLKGVPSDDWPIFELRDAVVLNKDGETLENALHVGIRGPFIVRGNLIIDDPSQRSHLVMRVRASTPLEIRKCVTFSIGESPDGSPLIWLSGNGGWYEINPSPAYRPIYQKMCEATTLFYNLVDIYSSRRAPKKPKKSRSGWMDELSGIFLQYAARIGDGSTFDEVVERCNEHAGFFISQFAQQETVLDWQPTAFYKWLTTEHADLVRQMEDVNKNPLTHSPIPSAQDLNPTQTERTTTPSMKSASVETIRRPPDVVPKKQSRGSSSIAPAAAKTSTPEVKPSVTPRSVKESPKEDAQPLDLAAVDDAAVADDSPFASVFRAVEDAYDALIVTKKGVKTLSVLNKLYFTYRFPNYKDGTSGCHKIPVREVLQYYSTALLQNLDKSKYEELEFWPYLEQLSQTAFHPLAYKLSDFPVRLVPRKQMVRKPKIDELAPDAGSSVRMEEDAGTDSSPAPRGKTLKRPGRKPGKKSSLRPVIPPKKRPRSQFESESESEASGLKNSHYFSDGDHVMDDAPEVETPQDEGTPVNGQPAAPGEEPIKILIRAEKIPSTVPHGPDDAWTCDREGCDYIVRGGDDDECQARIREHFHDHEQQIERVSLAVTESRGHLPINHLLEKIKRMGEKAQSHQHQQQTVNGMVLPQPIKRKLIV